ncbi:MAG: carbohydrate binding domain-containing protein, partial [Planctomycetota bacterium]
RNLDTLVNTGVNGGQWNHWNSGYLQAANYQTVLGNRRLDIVNFGFNHPLMPLLDQRDIEMQIRLQKHIHSQRFPGVPFSKGIFPPETAFSTRIIPALVSEGIEWAIADSIHVERATAGYPHNNSSGIFKPNQADQVNPSLESMGGQWVNLNGLWAPTAVAAPFAYRPHYVQYIDPETGAATRMVVVPGARYEGNEDGRGGFGALQYESVMSQYLQLNNDPSHPMFVLLHHDGDNFGGGSESYYNGNFNAMVNWLQNNSNFNATTIQDYLDRFPVANNDIVHIEDGSWAGADSGDPEFKRWLGDPGADGFSPDRNSWSVLTAARNRVFTADDISPAVNLNNIINGVGSSTEKAWHTLLQAQGSDHWYWDGTEVWDSNVTLGSNEASLFADQVIFGFSGQETTPPTLFVPQREPYNPGDIEFGGAPESSDFEVWTFAYDVSGLNSVVLNYRVDADGINPLDSIQNETFVGGNEVGDWMQVTMTSSNMPINSSILAATYRAQRYSAMIEGYENVLIDYYVEAVDANGLVTKSDIQHVWVGDGNVGNGGNAVVVSPDPPEAGESVAIEYDSAGRPLAGSAQVWIHYGVNGWSTVYDDLPMSFDATSNKWTISVDLPGNAEVLDIVFNDGGGVWDNNDGQDWHFDVDGATGPVFVMDGDLDPSTEIAAANNGFNLYYGLSDSDLYIATEDAGEGFDVFVYIAELPGELTGANWAKSGLVAQWDGFLADENDNGFNAWFDVSGDSATGSNGGVLEGVIDLESVFGGIPSEVYVAVGRFESEDGGLLDSSMQVPASVDNDGNIQVEEWVRIELDPGYLLGDMDDNGIVNLLDVAPFVLGIENPTEFEDQFGYAPLSRGDVNGDGSFNLLDVPAFVDLLTN